MVEPTTVIITGIGLLMFAMGADALLFGLVISSVFQATAYINIEGSPLILYYFFGMLFVLRNLLDIVWQPSVVIWKKNTNATLAWLWFFTAVSIVGAFILPKTFDGFLVYSPKLSIDEQYNNMTRLSLSSSHINQALQLLVNAFIFSIVWIRRVDLFILIRGLLCALGLTISFAAWQLLSNVLGIYYPDDLIYTVEGWSIGNHQTIGSFFRVNSVFLEPSTLATYLVGVFAFLLVWWVKMPSWVVLAAVVSTAICMLITTSTTAYLGLLFVVTIVFLGFALVQIFKDGWLDKTLFQILVAILLISWIASIVFLSSSDFRDLLDVVLTQKSEGDSFRARFEADRQSIDVIANTFGLGLGLGSNRPSSFLAFLASNVGALGLGAFIMFIVSISKFAIRSASHVHDVGGSAYVLAIVWALWCTLMAKVFAQPDLTFAPLWVWLFLLAAICTQQPRSLDRT